MATQKYSTHSVGNINSRENLVITEPFVKAGTDLENYSVVELALGASGEKTATYLSDITHVGYLACAIEYFYDNELRKEFYIGNGEYFRVIQFKTGLRFETSNFSGTPVVGQYAHFDPTTKKFVFDATPNATAKNVFQVVDNVTYDWSAGQVSVRLEVQ